MPPGSLHALPGAHSGSTNDLTLERCFMTKYGFSSNYWTTDDAEISKMKETYFNLHGASLPCVSVNPPKRGRYTSANLKLEIVGDAVNQIKKITDGHPFLLISQEPTEEKVIAFKYSTWWDGALMTRVLSPGNNAVTLEEKDTSGYSVNFTKNPEANSVKTAGIVHVHASDSKEWVRQNIQHIPEVCGNTFQNVSPNDEFGKELCDMAEYIYTEKNEGTNNESILIMKKSPVIRGKACSDVLYVELICSNIGRRSKQLIGEGGVADALAQKLGASKLLLSTLFEPSTLYAAIGFQFVQYENLT